MGAKSSKSGRQGQPSPGNGYGYPSVQQPVSQNRLVDALAERNLPPEEPKSSPPTLATAFFLGVFEFPFYLSCLGCLIGSACGLSFSFLVMVFALDQGFSVGAAVRPLGQSALMAFILTMSFLVAHCRSILEETAYGSDVVESWPGFDWKGWVVTFGFAATVFAEAAALSYILALPQLIGSPLPMLLLLFLLFPVFLLSAMESGLPFVPIAMPVLRSFKTIWWAWLLFYMETGVLLVSWVAVTVAVLIMNPYLSAFVSGTLLAAVLMIYARLLGRLTWCASQEESDDDD